MIADILRVIEPIKRKLMLMIGRCILTAVKNDSMVQLISTKGLKGETITDIERIEDYGLTSWPRNDSECVVVFVGGNREQGLALAVLDRDARPTDLTEGDVRVYDYRGNKITLNSDGIEAECVNGNVITMDSVGIKMECLNGNTVEMIASEVKVNGLNLEVLQ